MSRRKNTGYRRILGEDGTIQKEKFRQSMERSLMAVVCDSGHDELEVAVLSVYTFDDALTIDGRGHGTHRNQPREDGGVDLIFWCPRMNCVENEKYRITPAEPLEALLREAVKPGTRRRLPSLRLRDLPTL